LIVCLSRPNRQLDILIGCREEQHSVATATRCLALVHVIFQQLSVRWFVLCAATSLRNKMLEIVQSAFQQQCVCRKNSQQQSSIWEGTMDTLSPPANSLQRFDQPCSSSDIQFLHSFSNISVSASAQFSAVSAQLQQYFSFCYFNAVSASVPAQFQHSFSNISASVPAQFQHSLSRTSASVSTQPRFQLQCSFRTASA
jgi:hypothetical protein